MPPGWTVPGELHGWTFYVEPLPGGVHVAAEAAGGDPAVWFAPAATRTG
jgi:hypothetical protein